MKALNNQKGFNIVEMMIVLAVILIIIAISAGVYFAVTTKAEAIKLEKTLVKTIPVAIKAFIMDTKAKDVFTCYGGIAHLKANDWLSTRLQNKWRGPYLDADFAFNVEDGKSPSRRSALKDSRNPSITYSTAISRYMGGDPGTDLFPNLAKPPDLYVVGSNPSWYGWLTVVAEGVDGAVAKTVKADLGDKIYISEGSNYDEEGNQTPNGIYTVIYATDNIIGCTPP